MVKSLTAEWPEQLRQISRTPRKAAAQWKLWLDRLEGFHTATPPPRTRGPGPPAEAPSDPLPGTWTTHRCRLAPLPGELLPQLSYRIYEPASGSARSRPLVVMLHGCKQTPEDFAAGTRMNALAEREGFLVAYPEQPLRRQLQRCWQWFDLTAREGGREVQALAMLVDALADRHDVRRDQIYLAGLSAGAAMAGVLALRYPRKFAAVALHSGVVIGAADSPRAGLKAMRHGAAGDPALLLDAAGISPGSEPMPALILHGMEDDAVHPVNARLLARQFLAYNNLPDRLDGQFDGGRDAVTAMPAGHYVDARFRTQQRDLVQLCEIAGLGHAWSGGDDKYRFHSATGPDASMLMWDFFRQHRRRM
jgi:poly(3-hydroxybutyrate) depolymerase